MTFYSKGDGLLERQGWTPLLKNRGWAVIPLAKVDAFANGDALVKGKALQNGRFLRPEMMLIIHGANHTNTKGVACSQWTSLEA